MSRKRVGRRPKSEIALASLVSAFDPASMAPSVFHGGFDVINHAIPKDLNAKVEDLLSKLTEQFRRKAKDVQDDAQQSFRTIETLSSLRNLADTNSPETVIMACERIVSENNRLISTLLGHAMEYMMVVEEVKKIALSARQRAEDELSKLEPAFAMFMTKLAVDGVVVRDIVDITDKQRRDIISILKKDENLSQAIDLKDIPEVSNILDKIHEFHSEQSGQNVGISPSATTQNVGVSQNATKSVIYEETGAAGAENAADHASESPVGEVTSSSKLGASPVISVSQTSVFHRDEAVNSGPGPDVFGVNGGSKTPADSGMLDLNLPLESQKGSQILQSAKPVPSVVLSRVSKWADINLNPFGYLYLETTASTYIDMEALKITLPEHESLYDYALPNSPEYFFVKSAYENGSMEDFAKFIILYEARMHQQMSEMERRIWALLLLDYKRGPDLPLVGKGGFYHGIVLPIRPGTSRVARVEIISDRPEDVVNAFRTR